MKPLAYWIDGLRGFFREVEPRLKEMLDASGCREGWLQGEMFLHFRARDDYFYVNEERLSQEAGRRGRKADFSAYPSHDDNAALWMIGELKVLGMRGYQRKVLGLSLQPFLERLARGEVQLSVDELREDPGTWGLVGDYWRLQNVEADEEVPRLLVLVLDVRHANQADDLGKVLHALEFDPPAQVLHQCDSFITKCWPVPRRRQPGPDSGTAETAPSGDSSAGS
ncbi:hypothetical protein [Haliangium ochraceum]|uniref:Uncharacterized protein n=1 Tax=Haliangium ochraceum (strain DSM 14365 / JCM 11303 / SMP-2) TaxID=502025 RepID=D0LPL9_HALO1|nr:hypothetical protein [Haliangium ochraceum]ACY15382.1 hypothetical protein Hoch_2858 [Haliangium ochraceum DSM 14365]